MKDIFIVGSKGIPAQYGGYETFVDNLVTRRISTNIRYHVACMTFNKNVNNYDYYNAECQEICIPNIGGAKAIIYDLKALNWALSKIKERHLQNGIIYILACRIGPFIHSYKSKFHKYGFKIWVNPDGHEWMRAKWSLPVRKYWKISESGMVKNADLLICDSKNIEKYIHGTYARYNPKTIFIPYGADIIKSTLKAKDFKVQSWYHKYNIRLNEYFLIVGRFVPENNYETMIREFMKSDVKKDLVIITDVKKNKFYDKLKEKTHFDQDSRIKFVGTVYDRNLLKFIRENAYGYLHGHSVGGTNPSLLEALADTKLNLLYNVGFNREVGQNAALYWSKTPGFLSSLLNKTNKLSFIQINNLGEKARQRIVDDYSWKKIISEYEKFFLN